ncbi:MotA/TolQ/ExbB proton channel family protein [uncultured Sphingomonas sp.]|uniref:motility protein A n=1 Tax=uncultured Sphingomonas sp. TaxID=158754 RepID=UPI0025DB6C59|nr:MotA/TolQ/ExbB proton channel family protein [uncultured Sphingomonas sp.]
MDLFAQLGRLLDPAALSIVLGGAVLAAVLRGGWRAARAGMSALTPCFCADPELDAQAAIVAVGQAERMAEARSIVCVDRIQTTARFLREAVRRLADAPSSEAYGRWASETLEARARRHAMVIRFWRDVADAAPGMGMLATVLGLIRMFAHMNDPAQLGAPMATALVATLWGILAANLLAGPVADRLERLSEAELAWQRRTLDHFTALARAELDHARGAQHILQQRLAS